MVVQHNISAMNANRYYGINNKALAGSLEKLSSGYAINRAGDNAAGLAVSEKMRAQIGGLTQASKNAEDGISMVQTFEGALQETDTILQRMRTLAVQSANGNYQDDVDRDAIQLEFDQLNDELNQIADTDFNGVVMLNGGEMADGVKADDSGKIDYATKKEAVYSSVKNALADDLAAKQLDLQTKQNKLATSSFDLSETGAPQWNTVDNNQYDKGAADALWTDLGLTKTVSGNTVVDLDQADKVDITFTLQDNGSWKATSGTSYKGGEKVGSLDTLPADANITPTGNGGFSLKTTADGGKVLGNAIADAENVKAGSTITLTFTNGPETSYAPTNIGAEENSVTTSNKTTTEGATHYSDEEIASKITMEIGSDVTDANMKTKGEAIKAGLDALEGAQISIKGNNEAPPTDFTVGDVKIQSTDASNATLVAEGLYASVTDGVLQFQTTKDAADGVVLATVDATNLTAPTDGVYDDTVSLKVAFSDYDWQPTSGIMMTNGDDPNLESSAKLSAEVDKAQADANAAKAKFDKFSGLNKDDADDWKEIKKLYAETQSSSGAPVSVSDAYSNSMSKLSYTDKMTLQVGARTKDAVEFTFQYASDDLGGLEKNLNCSAREGGLNTASLSLRTAEDANDAIDKIDKALNKVNMVRATFGSVQNRLEHKINNLDTNTENLTAAESRIRDTQMDKEMMKFTSAQILSQASQSMLAQANSLPQGVLQLLG